MSINDVYLGGPGSRFLVSCPAWAQEDMIAALCDAMPADFTARTHLNGNAIASMDMGPDDNPSRFSDLLGLCAKLITAAGRRSHFEGLLLLNISALTSGHGNTARLKALGELLAIRDGLASHCTTLLYGPEKEQELLVCADCLDFDGRLKVFPYEQPVKVRLATLLMQSGLCCSDEVTEKQLEKLIHDMESYEGFSAAKLVRICGNEHGLITPEAVLSMQSDPYSYTNRIRKRAEFGLHRTEHRIGFTSDR